MPLQLHILTDTHLQSRWSHAELASMAFEGGADMVQVREKQARQLFSPQEWQKFSNISRQHHQKLILNDFVDEALAYEFDGVHVGLEDMAVAQARKLLGPKKLLGATVHSLEELENLHGLAVDYIGVGPVFGTSSKQTGLPPLLPEGLARIAAKSSFPVIAIGNVTLQNVARLKDTGIAGVAVLSAFCLDPDPVSVAAQFKQILG